jgi:hypothetical protein
MVELKHEFDQATTYCRQTYDVTARKTTVRMQGFLCAWKTLTHLEKLVQGSIM